MSKRSLAIISGVALIIAGIVIGFVLYGKNQVAQAPSPSEEYVAEKNEQAAQSQDGQNKGIVLGAETGAVNTESSSVSATTYSANIIQSVAERLALLQKDLILLRENEGNRTAIAIELENLKQELLAVQESGDMTPLAAGGTIAKAAATVAQAQKTEIESSAHRADLMITITAIGERLIALGKLTLAYKESLRNDSAQNPDVLVGVSYQ